MELENFKISADEVEVNAIIERTDEGTLYTITVPKISKPNEALLTELKHRLITEVMIGVSEVSDPKLILEVKKRFVEKANTLLDVIIPGTNKETKDFLIGLLMHQMLGLG